VYSESAAQLPGIYPTNVIDGNLKMCKGVHYSLYLETLGKNL
jgi:hypothetical protein